MFLCQPRPEFTRNSMHSTYSYFLRSIRVIVTHCMHSWVVFDQQTLQQLHKYKSNSSQKRCIPDQIPGGNTSKNIESIQLTVVYKCKSNSSPNKITKYMTNNDKFCQDLSCLSIDIVWSPPPLTDWTSFPSSVSSYGAATSLLGVPFLVSNICRHSINTHSKQKLNFNKLYDQSTLLICKRRAHPAH
jgi:hypothetical protein